MREGQEPGGPDTAPASDNDVAEADTVDAADSADEGAVADAVADDEAPVAEATEAEDAGDATEAAGDDASAEEAAAADDVSPVDDGEQQEADAAPELTLIDIEVNARKALQAQLGDTQKRLRAVSKAYQDMEKDMASFRSRTEAAMQARSERRTVDLAEKLFDPVQNLKRSLAVGGDPAQVVQGLAMIVKQFEDALSSFGLEEVPGEGAPFDPTVHEALAVMPVLDEAQDGKVVMVHNTGYRIGSRVLQPAQVIIGKYEKPAEA